MSYIPAGQETDSEGLDETRTSRAPKTENNEKEKRKCCSK